MMGKDNHDEHAVDPKTYTHLKWMREAMLMVSIKFLTGAVLIL